jgi:hypothetical protein
LPRRFIGGWESPSFNETATECVQDTEDRDGNENGAASSAATRPVPDMKMCVLNETAPQADALRDWGEFSVNPGLNRRNWAEGAGLSR